MDLLFINTPIGSDSSSYLSVSSMESGQDGIPANYVNPAYKFQEQLAPVNLPDVTSNVPQLPRSFGWINGG